MECVVHDKVTEEGYVGKSIDLCIVELTEYPCCCFFCKLSIILRSLFEGFHNDEP